MYLLWLSSEPSPIEICRGVTYNLINKLRVNELVLADARGRTRSKADLVNILAINVSGLLLNKT